MMFMDHEIKGLPLLLLRKFTLRHWQAAPRQSSLLVLILALGIGVFFSIRLANRAAVASFQNFTDLITQESDWLIQAPAGRLPEALLIELRERLGSEAVSIIPVFETTAALPATDPNEPVGSRETFQLLGVDLIAVRNLATARTSEPAWFGQSREARQSETGSTHFWESFRNPRAVFISQALADREHLRVNGPLRLVINDQAVSLEVAGIIPLQRERPQAPPTLLIMDLPAVQALAGRKGFLSRIEFIVEAGASVAERRAALRQKLEEWSGGRWVVSSPVDRRESAATMTRAFRLNLTILSLIALLVGLYLIFQALDGAVVRRREEVGILRSLGVAEGWVQRAWLLEAAFLGLAGGILGVVLGWLGAQFSVRLVGRTVNALYYSTSVQHARLDASEIAAAILLALAASLLAGWLPARTAARTPPAQVLLRHNLPAAGPGFWSKEWLGCVFVLVGFILEQAPPVRCAGGVRFPAAGYLAALCWIFGGGILGGWTLRKTGEALRPIGSALAVVRIAAGHLAKPSGRHRLAVAGLICAMAMTSGMAILVASFDGTMRGWIERTFLADLYLASSGAQSASSENRISADTWKQITADPAVEAVNVIQAREIQLASGKTVLSGADLSVMQQRMRLAWMQSPLSSDIFSPEQNSGLALVSESFTERFRLRRGDRIAIPTARGEKSVLIAGVFSDYGNERGSILIDRRHFAEWLQDDQASALAVWLRAGISAESVRTEWLTRHPALRIFSNARLRSEILRVFRQTFAITYALEVVGVLVAVIGLGLTLGSVLLERRAELTTLRALGLSRTEIAQATACEGAALALAGVAVGTIVSLALGRMLIYVINKQTFGWTLGFHLPWLQMAALALLVTGMGASVAYGVGRWGACLPADQEE